VSIELSPKFSLIIWNLLITGDQPKISEIRPGVTLKEVEPLEKAGFIKLVKRGRATHLFIDKESKAWDWAAENFHVEIYKSSSAAFVLEKLLVKLGNHLTSRGIALAELLSPQGNKEPNSVESSVKDITQSPDLEKEIQEAYARTSDGSGVGVLLATLRQYLSSFSRQEVDDMLRQMQLNSKLVLMRIDDPQAITSDDKDAAIDIGGESRHIVYLED